jgi:hypothetical protein
MIPRFPRAFGCADLREGPSGVDEAVGARAVGKISDDLPLVVDAGRLRLSCAGHLDLDEAAARVDEAVGARAVGISPDDLPALLMPFATVTEGIASVVI